MNVHPAYPVFSAAILLLASLGGCANYLAPLRIEKAEVGYTPATHLDLVTLPQPKEKIVAAVYKFRDQTGQYKASSTASTFSTAVTQGATSILLKALEESGWFVVIEREGLSNLLNERKIIRSSRAEYLSATADSAEAKQPLLPPLLFAGVLLEGGIISYDNNIVTGGTGVKYFGASASGQYREDRVTVYLRAISTQSGRILKTVYTSKTILSQVVDVGLYRFVDFQRLLEVETGYSYNEPPEMCVTEAIEKAVQSLIIEGLFDNLWALKDPSDRESASIRTYLQEKEDARKRDYYGNPTTDPGRFGIGLFGGLQMYVGDYPDGDWKSQFGAEVRYFPVEEAGILARAGQARFSAGKYFEATGSFGEVCLRYNLLPGRQMLPYLSAGGGAMMTTVSNAYRPQQNVQNQIYPFLTGGAGVEYFPMRNVGINAEGDVHYMLGDKLDAESRGTINDYYWSGRLGISYYLAR